MDQEMLPTGNISSRFAVYANPTDARPIPLVGGGTSRPGSFPACKLECAAAGQPPPSLLFAESFRVGSSFSGLAS